MSMFECGVNSQYDNSRLSPYLVERKELISSTVLRSDISVDFPTSYMNVRFLRGFVISMSQFQDVMQSLFKIVFFNQFVERNKGILRYMGYGVVVLVCQ